MLSKWAKQTGEHAVSNEHLGLEYSLIFMIFYSFWHSIWNSYSNKVLLPPAKLFLCEGE